MEEKMLGVMLDCSRNAVMTPETVKTWAHLIRKMGYNTLMLYTEDTYTIDSQPYFGHFRGRYTHQELRELDTFCADLGLSLVPCIQTLAHLETMFKWESVYDAVNDCADILLIDDERTYALIDQMLQSAASCFRSRRIHVGMDEAHRVGTGKYLARHPSVDRFDLICRHLRRVASLAEKYGFELMIWSDMFLHSILGADGRPAFSDPERLRARAALPENVSLVYWDYYTTDPAVYEARIRANRLFGRDVIYAGGAQCWGSFAPDNASSIQTLTAAAQACKTSPVDGVLLTLWGDDGSECSRFAALPALFFAARVFSGQSDPFRLQSDFSALTGLDRDAFTLLDALDKPGGKHRNNVSKYLLYNDPFLGIYDARCALCDDAYYEHLADALQAVPASGVFAPLFDSCEALARVLSRKATLGIRTRSAYAEKDLPALRALVADYGETLSRLRAFYEAYQRLWFSENRPQGFEVQTIRLGGLMQRLADCQARLRQYCSGELSAIAELEEPILEEVNGPGFWSRIVSANVIEPRRG